MENRTLVVAAALAIVGLPIFSAITLPRSRWQYIRCLIAYATVFLLIDFGYFFQGAIESITTQNRLNSDINWFGPLLSYRFHYTEGLGGLVLASSMICWAALLAKNQRDRPVYCFRAAFVVLMSFDIIIGMVAGFDPPEYLKNVVFDFVGAAAFGCVAAALLRRIMPATAKRVTIPRS
jgi:hypothetical protein